MCECIFLIDGSCVVAQVHIETLSVGCQMLSEMFSFVSLHSVIGPENSRQSLSQSKVRLTWALVFSHASVASRLPVFTLTNCFNMNATMN